MRIMENKVRTQSFSKGERIALLFMLVFIQVSVFVPVWQAGENRSVAMALQKSSRNVTLLEEEKRVLQSQIAQAQMPEYLIDSAVAQDIYFQQIAPEGVVRVASSGGGSQ